MSLKSGWKVVWLAAAVAGSVNGACAAEEGKEQVLFDGTVASLTNWRVTEENPGTWRLEDGALVTRGERSHIFYVGEGAPWTDFELKVEVMTEKGANGGIYFHTAYQPSDWPHRGYEAQVNNTGGDWRRTGSLYGVADAKETAAVDGEWFTETVRVEGRRIRIWVNDTLVTDFTEEPDRKAGSPFTRKLESGTIGLQAHDPGSVVRYRNIRIRRL